MVLDKNPENYFAEIEQSAFSPAHMTPGVEASPDKMLQVRKNDVKVNANLQYLLINTSFSCDYWNS